MNKELYTQQEKIKIELDEIEREIRSLSIFLRDYEKSFKRNESIESLKTIKAYLLQKEQEYQKIYQNYCELEKELISTCNHEIVLNRRVGSPEYECLMCKSDLGKKLPPKSLISIDISNDYKFEYLLEDILKKLVHSNLDLVETISNAVEEMQYEREIKVYRRQI